MSISEEDPKHDFAFAQNSKATNQAMRQLQANFVNERTNGRRFHSPADVIEAFCEYVEWVNERPIRKPMGKDKDGDIIWADMPRSLTMPGFRAFAGIGQPAWSSYTRGKRGNDEEQKEEFREVTLMIQDFIHSHKLEYGLLDIFNAGLVARLVGLAERREISGPDGEAIRTINSGMSQEEAAEAYRETLTSTR